MKSNELFEEIHCGRIKEGTKIKVIDELTGNCISKIEYKNQRLNWISGEFDTSFLCNIDIDFEVIEENKEIEELPNELIRDDWTYHTIKFHNKINELVQAVNKINKQLEEQEIEDIDTVERELNKMF